MRALPRTSLLREPDFRRFWLAGVVSALGSGVTALALPLTAVLLLGASAIGHGRPARLGDLPGAAARARRGGVGRPAAPPPDHGRRRPRPRRAPRGRAAR